MHNFHCPKKKTSINIQSLVLKGSVWVGGDFKFDSLLMDFDIEFGSLIMIAFEKTI